MKYMILLYGSQQDYDVLAGKPTDKPAMTPQEVAAMHAYMGEYNQRLVDSGAAQVAFALHSTSIEDLLRVSDAGGVMPPKSTWFEPKLRDAILIHTI